MSVAAPRARLLARVLLALPLCTALAGCPAGHGDPNQGDGALLDLGRDGNTPQPSDGGRDRACAPLDPRMVPAEVSVQPEDGEAPFVDVLKGATRSIRVFCYLMGKGSVLDTLKAKAAAGVDVRVILDQGYSANQDMYLELQRAGITVLWSDPQFPYMHAKAMVVDDSDAVVSTGNYSAYYIARERNYVVRLRDPDDVADIARIFDDDYRRAAPDLRCTRLLVSPVNSKDRLLGLINGARKSVLIESMQFAETDVRVAVAARRSFGIDVRVLLADPGWITANNDAAAYLARAGVPVRYLRSLDVHVKSVLVDPDDDARAYAGSENLSYTSLTKNRELGVFLTEPAAVRKMRETFEADWAKATPFPQ